MVKNMRLPMSCEYDKLLAVSGASNTIIHWKDIFSWCQDISPKTPWTRVIRGFDAADTADLDNAWTQDGLVGFRPAFELSENSENNLLPDGEIITVGTLFMDGTPVKIPENPTRKGDITRYIPNAKLEIRPAIDNPNYHIRAIKTGNVYISDRVLLKNISWDECQPSKLRLPTFAEYDALIKAVNGQANTMHCEDMHSWCHEQNPDLILHQELSEYHKHKAALRDMHVGFRPVIKIKASNSIPDGSIIPAGALCMDGVPVEIPQNPVWNGDIQDYIPGARLTLRPDAGYPKYQISAIKIGNVLIADRCLLKNISWEDCQMATAEKLITFMH